MASLNQVTLMGVLVKDPKLSLTCKNVKRATFILRTADYIRKKTGERLSYYDYHMITCYGINAEIVRRYLRKNSQTVVLGKLRNRMYDDPKYGRRFIREIFICEIQCLGDYYMKSQGFEPLDFGEEKTEVEGEEVINPEYTKYAEDLPTRLLHKKDIEE